MKVGFIGLGKLGMPCAVAMALKGHDVIGYDIDEKVMHKNPRPYKETGPDGISDFNDCLRNSTIRFGNLSEVVSHSKIIFVAVQTPHEPEFEGISKLSDKRANFKYTFLEKSLQDLTRAIKSNTIVAIVSTVLPGTIRNHLLPIIKQNSHIKLCYNPLFIAMGTTMRDFLQPEFVLVGANDKEVVKKVEAFYGTITHAACYKTTMEDAEVIKVAYNTFIGIKIVFANTVMEICHKMPGTNVDQVTAALKLAKTRLTSDKYMSGGMGDGGSCHPRDNIAMSWLAKELNLSWDLFGSIMMARENQTEWLASVIEQYDLPIVILGKSFKPCSNIVTGSPAILLKNILEERGHKVKMYDPYVDTTMPKFTRSVFFIGTKHSDWLKFTFPKGSVIIDPWRYIPNQTESRVIRIGE